MQPRPYSSCLTLRPSKLKWILILLIGLLFVITGLFSMSRSPLAGAFCTLFFALVVLGASIQLAPGASYLRLTDEGMEVRSLFRKWPLLAWRDVSTFRLATVPGKLRPMVVFDHNTEAHPTLRQFNRALVGAGNGLPDSYGMSPAELADLLNQWRARVTPD